MKKKLGEKKTKSGKKKIIIISAISLVVLLAAGFFIFESINKNNFQGKHFGPGFNASERGGNFTPINETTQSEITSFFGNSPSSSEVDAYCKTNPYYCMYYCRQINSSNSYCANFNFSNRNFSKGVPPPQ